MPARRKELRQFYMKMSKFIKFSILGLFFFCLPVFAEINKMNINWEYLNLTPKQKHEVAILDKRWKKVNAFIRPQLLSNQQKLKTLLSKPNIPDEEIRELQKQIFLEQTQLRSEALENFLSKKRLLDNKQRQVLLKMLSK